MPDLDRDPVQRLSDFNRELLEAHDEVVEEILARLEAMKKRSPDDAKAFARLLDWLDRNGGGAAAA